MKYFTITYIVVFFVMALTQKINAQTTPPILDFNKACASPAYPGVPAGFNEFNLEFSSGVTFGASNQFIVELSDGNGEFANPTVVYTSNPGEHTTFPVTVTIALPTDTAGEAYRLRVKSTQPANTGVPSVSFPAYYQIQNTYFTINNFIPTAQYCAGGSYVLTIDNPGTGANDSPLQYPSLTFKWYRETGLTSAVFIATGNSLEVNQPGTYFVETDYGSCTPSSNSYSNRVVVSEYILSGPSAITSSLGNPYCVSEGPTVLSAESAVSYQWYKDGIEIPGATNQNYSTSDTGEFSVDIDLGPCNTTASITLEAIGFSSSIDVDVLDVVMLEEDETLLTTVTTSANSPEFKWYLNDVLIPNAISSSYELSQIGNYKVEITQTIGCIATSEITFQVGTPFPDVAEIPNLISPNGDGINDTWVIPKAYLSDGNASITIISAQGKIVLQTDNYLNNWPENQLDFKSVNPVYYYVITTSDNKTKKGSITVVK